MTKPKKSGKTTSTTYTAKLKFFITVGVEITEKTDAKGEVTSNFDQKNDALLDAIYSAVEDCGGEVTDVEMK